MVGRIRERVCGLTPLKKLVYLISPNKINQNFYTSLDKVLSNKNVKFFQLRLKDKSQKNLINICKKIRIITNKYKVKFIINDNYALTSEVKANGCHMGQQDGSFKDARKRLKGKILGITCHNSRILAKDAVKSKADYIAFGSFFKSKLKPKAKKANIYILRWAKKNTKKSIVAIGGINNLNYKKLIKAGAKYIAISSYIWDNPKLKPEIAIREFK